MNANLKLTTDELDQVCCGLRAYARKLAADNDAKELGRVKALNERLHALLNTMRDAERNGL
jgi:hypothetical protein